MKLFKRKYQYQPPKLSEEEKQRRKELGNPFTITHAWEISIRVERKKTIEQRFHELAVKSAIGKATPEEEKKLDRYQALRRPKRTASEIRAEAEQRYKTDRLLKTLKAAIWEAESIPKEDEKHGWRKNRHLTVYANKAEDAIELVKSEYPTCAIWNVQHRGQRSSKGSMIWERTYH